MRAQVEVLFDGDRVSLLIVFLHRRFVRSDWNALLECGEVVSDAGGIKRKVLSRHAPVIQFLVNPVEQLLWVPTECLDAYPAVALEDEHEVIIALEFAAGYVHGGVHVLIAISRVCLHGPEVCVGDTYGLIVSRPEISLSKDCTLSGAYVVKVSHGLPPGCGHKFSVACGRAGEQDEGFHHVGLCQSGSAVIVADSDVSGLNHFLLRVSPDNCRRIITLDIEVALFAIHFRDDVPGLRVDVSAGDEKLGCPVSVFRVEGQHHARLYA